MAIPPRFDRRLALAVTAGASGASGIAIFVLPYLVSWIFLDHPPDRAALASVSAVAIAVLTSDFPSITDCSIVAIASLILDSCGPKVHAIAKLALSKRFLTSGFDVIAGSVPRSLRDGSAKPLCRTCCWTSGPVMYLTKSMQASWFLVLAEQPQPFVKSRLACFAGPGGSFPEPY